MPEEMLLLKEWKDILGLQDWYILLQANCDPSAMMPEADGEAEYTETTKSAVIRIIDPEKRGNAIRPFAFEETLVHELLHLKFCLLEQSEDWENDLGLRVMHQIIDDLAKGFAEVKRKANASMANRCNDDESKIVHCKDKKGKSKSAAVSRKDKD